MNIVKADTNVLAVSALVRMFGVFFFGLLGREILMDIRDLPADAKSGVMTVPVRYGKVFAFKAVGIVTVVASILAIGPHLLAPWQNLRRLVLATLGSASILRNLWNIFKTKAEDATSTSRVIGQYLIGHVCLMASFV